MSNLTRAQRKARAAAIIAETERTGCGTLEAIRRVVPQFTETAPTRPTTGRKAGQPGKSARRARQIAEAVTEALTANAAPSLPSGVSLPSAKKTASKAPARLVEPHKMTDDELAAATVAQASDDAESPFWRGARESAPAAPVQETAQPAAPAVKPLHEMSEDELLAAGRDAFGAHARDRGFASPLWAA